MGPVSQYSRGTAAIVSIIYTLILFAGIALPARHADDQATAHWWQPLVAAVLIGAAAAVAGRMRPRPVSYFAIGTAVGCTIGIVGAPFWHHANQEPALVAGLLLSGAVLFLCAGEMNRRRYDTRMMPVRADVRRRAS
ncbi:hypothetical protein [Streptacidiphilus carbonis]|jgi:peptidoglycan/LPS O-acetylase OafA/YrhL|uniref:hypothetical protein n=1 Tax=Streptacidiphilus carbonis TaxID=105422 RepID=UPI00126A2F9A|nr:hypothetical protein [Streptacidiphilus carbonis]